MEDVCALREIAGALIREIAPLVGGFSALLTLSFFFVGSYSGKKKDARSWQYRSCVGAFVSNFCLSMFIFVVDHSGVAAGIVQVIIFVAMYFLYFHAIDLKDWNS